MFVSHCDIVVEVLPKDRIREQWAETSWISFLMSVVDIDAEGFLIMPKDQDNEARPWFAVMNLLAKPGVVASSH